MKKTRHRSIAAWLAIAAMALQALWPLVAQAKPRAVALVPVCTVDGVTHYLELKTGDTPLEQKSASHQDHCAFCSFESGRGAALPSAPVVPFVPQDPAEAAIDAASPPQAQSLHVLLARPRAPPAIA